MFLELIKLAVVLPENLSRVKFMLGSSLDDPVIYQSYRRLRKLFTLGDDAASAIKRFGDKNVQADIDMIEAVLKSRSPSHQLQIGNLIDYIFKNSPQKTQSLILRGMSGRASKYKDVMNQVTSGPSRKGFHWWKDIGDLRGSSAKEIMNQRLNRITNYIDPDDLARASSSSAGSNWNRGSGWANDFKNGRKYRYGAGASSSGGANYRSSAGSSSGGAGSSRKSSSFNFEEEWEKAWRKAEEDIRKAKEEYFKQKAQQRHQEFQERARQRARSYSGGSGGSYSGGYGSSSGAGILYPAIAALGGIGIASAILAGIDENKRKKRTTSSRNGTAT